MKVPFCHDDTVLSATYFILKISLIYIKYGEYLIKLMKGKALRKHSLHEKTAAYWQPRSEPYSLTHKIVPYCGVHHPNKIIYVV